MARRQGGSSRLRILAVGRIKERGLRELVDDYLARVRRHVPCDEIEVRDGRHVHEAIAASIPAGAHVVALETNGTEFDSKGFARWLEGRLTSGKGVVVFVMGGADGIPEETVRRADERISLSRLTMAHRVARVVLAEQIYRATSLWRGEPYHR